MRNFLTGLLAAITLGSLPAYTNASPQNEPIEDPPTIYLKPVPVIAAKYDEVEVASITLTSKYLMPMIASMTRMRAYLTIEPQKACDAAKKINQLSVDGIAFYQSEKQRLSAKNKDTSELDSIGKDFDQMPEMSKQIMDAACSKEASTYIDATPNKLATSPVLLHMADTFEDFTLGLYSKEIVGDTKTACESIQKAETDITAAQKSLDAGKDVIDVTTKEDLEKQISDLHGQIQEQVTACKAA